ncbi:hypothetical protein B0A54_04452 [Friedmanniomyces endolithicus]|uniref:C3H1-type domain-containing protein n=1 Tax=Friedmanniomyces endolithicus TaxID=329885 RepID=A0A4U0VBB8_9PEZI|nr:hypothetical protein LTS09_010746 [Friedmanniomyces endolithicus]TKA45356.1 hypothetical protein B0A54_04452 [Friedmanniomyces endolithicus]
MANLSASTNEQQPAKPCWHWLMGHCNYGEKCRTGAHPANLDGRLVDTKNTNQAFVSNRKGEACQRCLTRMYKCDKLVHAAGPEDPCSECRHFGGPGCKCTLNNTMSYNDQAWRTMLQRGNHDYTLPADNSRTEGTSNKPPPSEMPEHELKPGWTGASKDALVAAADYLPSGVRDCPRAYLVPATETKRVQKGIARNEQLATRLAASSTSIPAGRLNLIPVARSSLIPTATSQSIPAKRRFVSEADAWPTAPTTGAPMERPPPHPLHGKVKSCLCEFDEEQWTLEYEDGTTITTRLNGRPAKVRRTANESVVLEPPRVSDASRGREPPVFQTRVYARPAMYEYVDIKAENHEPTLGSRRMVFKAEEDSE